MDVLHNFLCPIQTCYLAKAAGFSFSSSSVFVHPFVPYHCVFTLNMDNRCPCGLISSHRTLKSVLVHSKKGVLVTVSDSMNTSSAADLGHVTLCLCASITRMELKLWFFAIRLAVSRHSSHIHHLLNGPSSLEHLKAAFPTNNDTFSKIGICCTE